MPPMSRKTKRSLLLGAVSVALTFLLSSARGLPLHGLSSLLYGVLLIAWLETLRARLSGDLLRRCVFAAVISLFLLFPLRECRYTVFAGLPAARRFLWYFYYVPILASPLFFFFAALCVDRREEESPLGRAPLLALPTAALALGFLTNDLHSLALRLPESGNESFFPAGAHGPVFWAAAAWIALLNVSAFFLLIRRCRRSAARRLWFLPFLAALPPLLLLALYALSGGSPAPGGIKTYNFQEAYSLLYVSVWECLLEIGLVPSSAGYDAIFRIGSLGAAVADMDGTVVYASKDVPDVTPALIRTAADHPVPVGANRRLRSTPIPGGSVIWTEDLTEIVRLNEELERVNEALSAENAVLEAENEVKETRARFEAANRLWDGIVEQVRPQLRALGSLLGDGSEPTGGELAECAFLGAYIKRRSNLSLIAEGSLTLSSEELGLAVRESLSYLSLCGILCSVREEGSAVLTAEALTLAYEIFEEAAEGSLRGGAGSLLVTLRTSGRDGNGGADRAGRFALSMLFDGPPPEVSSARLTPERIAEAGGTLSLSEEDGAGYLRFEVPCAPEEGGAA